MIQVMAHEFGHGIGLLHSANRHSIMQPFYAGYNAGFKLGQDDITAAQLIYGRQLGNVLVTMCLNIYENINIYKYMCLKYVYLKEIRIFIFVKNCINLIFIVLCSF